MSPPTRSLRVGLTQWAATPAVEDNLRVAVELIDAAAPASPDLVLLPENGLCLGSNAEMRAAALTLHSPEVDALRAAAQRARTVVVLGGFKRLDDNGSVFNTALVIGPNGELAGGYDKIHLFDARVDGRTFEASKVEKPGDRPVRIELAGASVGLTICYDVRFPELYRRLAAAGAEVLLVPAAFTEATGRAHWEVLLRARAIENAAFVVASATVRGDSGSDVFPTYGHAMVVDPWGDVLVDLGEQRRACEVIDLDLTEVERRREQLPVLRGTRPEAYAMEPHVVHATGEEHHE